jgi:chromosome segregation ATPase
VDPQRSDLPGYEEIIASLAPKLEGLSTVHRGLGEAAESLILAQYEMAETKQRLELLARSAQEMVEEVQRLQPGELTSTLNATLDTFSREASESIDALEQRAAARNEALTGQLLLVEESLTSTVTVARTALVGVLDEFRTDLDHSLTESDTAAQDAFNAIRGAVAVVNDRLNAHAHVVAEVAKNQHELALRIEQVFPLISALNQQHEDLSRQASTLAEELSAMRKVVDATQATSHTTHQIVERAGPAVEESLRTTRILLLQEIKRSRRTQLVSLVLVLIAVVLTWASLTGLIPNV